MIDATQYPFIQLILGYAETGTEIYKWSKESVAVLADEFRSLLTSNAVNAQLAAEWEAKHHALRTQIAEMGREMASVVAERDALKAQQPKVERKLREVKEVTYRDGRWWFKHSSYKTVSSIIARWNVTFTDADHAAIYALKDDPYEPVETVEEVLRWVADNVLTPTGIADACARLRAAFAAEQGGAE